MMFFENKRLIFVLMSVVFCFIFSFSVFAESSQIQVSQTVTGCDNNGVCAGLETVSNCPNDCYSGGGPQGDLNPPNILNLTVIPFYDAAVIIWDTTEPANSVLRWGKTQEYEGGVISEAGFLENHKIFLIDVSPDTEYHFRIDYKDENSNANYTFDQVFKTLSEPDLTAPSNVSNFSARVVDFKAGKAIELIWENPKEIDFAGVRIVRSEKFFPKDISDGLTIYDGSGEYFLDKDVLPDIRYYYSAFAYDRFENYASGAVAFAVFVSRGEIVPPEIIIPEAPPEEVPAEVKELSLEDFEFYQKGERLEAIGDKIYINAGENLEIRLEYAKTPEILKTIIVTLIEPSSEKKTFSFLLKINKDKSDYEAEIAPLGVSGLYEVSIAVLDYKNQSLKKFKTFLFAEAQAAGIGKIILQEEGGFSVVGYLYIYILPWLLFLMIVVLLLFLIKKIANKRKKDITKF